MKRLEKLKIRSKINKNCCGHCKYLTKREVPHPQSPERTININYIPEGDLFRVMRYNAIANQTGS